MDYQHRNRQHNNCIWLSPPMQPLFCCRLLYEKGLVQQNLHNNDAILQQHPTTRIAALDDFIPQVKEHMLRLFVAGPLYSHLMSHAARYQGLLPWLPLEANFASWMLDIRIWQATEQHFHTFSQARVNALKSRLFQLEKPDLSSSSLSSTSCSVKG